MNLRRTTLCIALLSIGLTGCGSPNDLPIADTGSRVAFQNNSMPTPTFVPTAPVEAIADPALTPTPSASPTPTAEPAPEPTAEPNVDAGHPVAREIAAEFGVSVAEVEGFHAQGIGYGILAQFYSIAYQRCEGQSSYTVAQLVEMHLSGIGMGEIRKQALGSAAANECSLGQIKQDELDKADQAQGGPPSDTGKPSDAGNGKEKDKGKPSDTGNGKEKDKGKPSDAGNGKGKGKDK